ncbi:hypothetical protein KXR87_11375 [Yokenella regensburgei]|uniref:hypothetical protein n=1 Tax=Yokenella regensburgei TaxID=158877 RepID=UPI003F13E6DB
MKKTGRRVIYVLVVIIFFLIIPEIVIRVLTPDQFARLSDYTSFGGLFSHLLSVLIFLGVASILAAMGSIYIVRKIYQGLRRVKDI